MRRAAAVHSHRLVTGWTWWGFLFPLTKCFASAASSSCPAGRQVNKLVWKAKKKPQTCDSINTRVTFTYTKLWIPINSVMPSLTLQLNLSIEDQHSRLRAGVLEDLQHTGACDVPHLRAELLPIQDHQVLQAVCPGPSQLLVVCRKDRTTSERMCFTHTGALPVKTLKLCMK